MNRVPVNAMENLLGQQPEKKAIKRREIVSKMTRTRFIKVEDALEIGKLRIYAGEYVPGQGQTVYAFHFMDIDDARVVFSDIADGRAVKYQEYKGSALRQAQGAGHVSRMLQVKSAAPPASPPNMPGGSIQGGGVDAYWFELVTRPGQRMRTGAVKPAGEPTAQVSIGLKAHTARALAHAVLAYLRAAELAVQLGRMNDVHSSGEISVDVRSRE
mgnify:CR=1 FL=1